MIETTEHRVILPYLPPELRGLRLAQLSDFHRSRLTPDSLIRHAVACANEARPDLLLLTGDFVTQDPKDIAPCMHLLAPLKARLGVFAVLGNHDYTADARATAHGLERLGFTVLTNQNHRLEQGLCIAGLEDDRYGTPDAKRMLHGISAREPLVVMSHNPVGAEHLADRECLVVSGHTHGGQVRMPLLTAREVRRIGAKHYREGWFTVGKAQLYVNRGLGRTGLPVRFLCKPELSLFTLG